MKKMISLMLVALLAVTPLFGASAEQAQDSGKCIIYVSPTGNDAADGSITAPLKTIEAARNKIRTLKTTDAYPNGYTVYLRGGEYNVASKISFGAKDSGTEDAPILYTNYSNEKVTLVGGQAIEPDDFTKVTDAAILDILADQSVRDEIYQVDLKQYGITDVGEPYLFGAYSYSGVYDFLTAPDTPASELFINNRALTVARYPNEGMMSADRVIEMGWDADTKAEGTASSDPFIIGVSDERIKKWETSVNAQSEESKNKVLMYGWWKYDWCDQSIPIAAIDQENLNITSAWSAWLCPDTRYGTRNFYVYNLIEELDIPGEYYMDYDNCILYVYPPEDISQLDASDICFSLISTELISVYNAQNITFSGIDISAGRKYGYYIDGCTNVVVENCEITNTASKAARIINGTSCGIRDSYLHDVNGGVVISGGDEVTLTAGNNFVSNCHIENFSRLTKNYNGAIDVGGVGNIVKNNEIHGGAHLAISFGGQNHEIMYNDIYNVCAERYDTGAIYGGLTWVGRGCKVMYNYIHDMETTSTGGLGISAVYMDGGQCDMTVSGNVFANIKGGAIWLGGGQDVVMENNYFINCKDGLWLQNPMPNVDLNDNHYPRYNALDQKADLANNEYWKQAFPKLYTFMAQSDDEKRIPKNNTFRNNIAYGSKLYKGGESCKAEAYIPNLTTENLVFEQDPGFVNYDDKNFMLRADSAAFELEDFYAIPFDEIGRIEPRLLSLDAGYQYDLGFASDKMNYMIMLPYCNGSIEIPTITAIPADDSQTISITYPTEAEVKAGNGFISIVVSDTMGMTQTYSIALVPIGASLYANGGGETGNWSWSYGTGEQVTNNVGEGNYSIELRGGAYYMPDKTPELIQGNVTYLASSMVRLSDSYTGTKAIKAQAELRSPNGSITDAFTDATYLYFNADGTKDTSPSKTVNKTDWITEYRTICIHRDEDSIPIVDRYMNNSSWKSEYLTVDGHFLGELVVSGFAFTCDGKAPAEDITVSSTASTQIDVDAKALNQLGNSAGLAGETDLLWRVASAPEGVSIDAQTGVLTIAPATEGTIVVEVSLKPSYEGARQDVVKERLSLHVSPEGFSMDDNGEVRVRYVNREEASQMLDVYYVTYSVDSFGKKILLDIITEPYELALGEALNVSKKIELPKGKILMCFLWKNDVIPVVKNGIFE